MTEIEGNDTRLTAQPLDGNFSLDFSPDIGDSAGVNTSTSIPHVTVNGTGNGTPDFYSFIVSAPFSQAYFDIDYGHLSRVAGAALDDPFDSIVRLFDATGNLLGVNDDTATTAPGAGGSVSALDSFLAFNFAQAGVYYVEVNSATAVPGGVPAGSDYRLQVSLQNAPTLPATPAATPEPSSLALLGIVAGAGLVTRLRRRRRGDTPAIP